MKETRHRKGRKKDARMAKCLICGHEARCITSHLYNEHGMTGREYIEEFRSPVFAADLEYRFKHPINPWNDFEKLFQTLTEKEKLKVIHFTEEIAGRKLR